MKNLLSANIVIIANNLNPSIFSQLWLVKEGIVDEKDFAENCVFTPVAAQVFTPDFQLLVLPDRLQFGLTDESKDNSELIKDKVTNIVQKLPHTPYIAIGANLHWKVAPDVPEQFIDFMRNLFMKPQTPLYNEFSGDDARLGSYMSKKIFGTRLKLEIKPVNPAQIKKNADTAEFLQFHFNYNLDLTYGDSANKIDKIVGFLSKWDQMREESEKIVFAALSNDSQR